MTPPLPLVLIPGFMLDSTMWDDVRPALEQIGPVQFGDTTQDDSIEGMAQRIADAAPPRFVAVGFSMGGYVAREVVRLVPGRVRALILIATSARGDTPDRKARRAKARHAAESGFRGLSRTAVARSLHPDRSGDPALIGRLQAMGDRLGGEVFHRQTSLRRDGDLGQLGAINCPTLVVAASDDRLRSMAEAEELRAGIANAQLVTVPDTGHMIPLEQPDALVAAMRAFLTGLD